MHPGCRGSTTERMNSHPLVYLPRSLNFSFERRERFRARKTNMQGGTLPVWLRPAAANAR